MSKAQGSSYRIVCPSCQASLKAWPEQAGTQFKCPRCGKVMAVPTAAEAAAPPRPTPAPEDRPPGDDEYALSRNDRRPAGSRPAYINVVCPVCATRMYATPDQIGQTLVCPDCGTKVEVTQPPPELFAESPHTRIVYEGSDEYALRLEGSTGETPVAPYTGETPVAPGRTTESDGRTTVGSRTGETPVLPSDVAGETEIYIPVVCPLCHTRMHATLPEVGRKKACPDCGTVTVVPQAPKPEAKPSRRPVAFEGSDEYALREERSRPGPPPPEADPLQIPVVCPLCQTRMHAGCEQVGKTITCPDCGTGIVVPPPAPAAPRVEIEPGETYEVEALPAERKPLVEELPRRAVRDEQREPPEEEEEEEKEERPELPAWPFVTGVFRFLETADGLARLFGVSVAAVVTLFVLDFARSILQGLSGGIGAAIAALVGMVSLLLGGLLALCWLVVVAAQCLGILEQTAHGRDHIESPDAVWLDWVFDLFYVVDSIALAFIPGLLVAQQYVPGSPKFYLAMIASEFFLFPLVLLSMLERGSAVNPFSISIWRSVGTAFGAWVQFYVVSAVLLGVTGFVLRSSIGSLGKLGLCIAGTVLTAGLMLYFRLLGRLGWCCAEALRQVEPEEPEHGAKLAE